jgi:uncharacterized SAM-binding protein YcdF (DUF218 family)
MIESFKNLIRWLIQKLLLLGFIILLIIGAFAYKASDLYHYQDTIDGVHLPETDVIVCLAGGKGRIASAGDLWLRYQQEVELKILKGLPMLFFSGVGSGQTWSTVSKQMRRGVVNLIKADHIHLEDQSLNTEENAKYFIDEAKKKNYRRMVLLTSSYHMKRAKRIFEVLARKEKLPLEIQTYTLTQDPYNAEDWTESLQGIHVTTVEFMKWLYYDWIWSKKMGDSG